jgi:hypothetical protein
MTHAQHTRALAGLHPYRTGFCDGIFNRESCSPWAALPLSFAKSADYLRGYLEGEKRRQEDERAALPIHFKPATN